MSQPFNYFLLDHEKAKAGTWVDHPTGRFKIASKTAKETQTYVQARVKAIQKKYATSKDPLGRRYKVSDVEMQKCAIDFTVENILIDWDIEGFEFNKENALKALESDREYSTYDDMDDDEIESANKKLGADKLEKLEMISELMDDPDFFRKYVIHVHRGGKYESMIDFIMKESNRLSNFEREQREEDVKKSLALSSGEIEQN